MHRRDFLRGLATPAAIYPKVKGGLAAAAPAGSPASGIDVVKRFGFVADGRTCNYEAFHRLAAYASQARGGRYIFPPGTYYVARYRATPQALRNPRLVINAEWTDCDGLTLSGRGAVIKLNGRFHRSGKPGSGGHTIGVHYATFMPFEIRRCRNVVIEGFEMDGGVRGMTRDLPVWEGYAHLIALSACSNVLLQDLVLRHSQVDAILLSDDVILGGPRPGRACRNITLRNVKCLNNARGGLAPLQVHGLLATDCEFNGNGYPPGAYLYHEPGFGVCIEPDRTKPGVEVDIRTGNLEFRRCNFYDNRSAIQAAYPGSYSGFCRFVDCNTRNRNNAPNHIIATWPGEGLLIEGGEHDAGAGCIHLSWDVGGGKTVLRGANIRSSHIFGLLHVAHGSLAEVTGCSLIGTHRDAATGHFPFFGQNPGGGRRNTFRDNRVFIPAAHKEPGKTFDLEPNFNHTDLSGNEYSTDLAVPGQAFVTVYDLATCRVRNERFVGRFPGRRDTFRPMSSDAHDTRLPYSAG